MATSPGTNGKLTAILFDTAVSWNYPGSESISPEFRLLPAPSLIFRNFCGADGVTENNSDTVSAPHAFNGYRAPPVSALKPPIFLAVDVAFFLLLRRPSPERHTTRVASCSSYPSRWHPPWTDRRLRATTRRNMPTNMGNPAWCTMLAWTLRKPRRKRRSRSTWRDSVALGRFSRRCLLAAWRREGLSGCRRTRGR